MLYGDYTRFHANRTINVECMDRNFLTPLRKSVLFTAPIFAKSIITQYTFMDVSSTEFFES